MTEPQAVRLSQLSCPLLRDHLRSGRLALHTGSLVTRIRSEFVDVAASLSVLYAHHPVSIDPEFADFHVEVASPRNFRRWFNRQAEFLIDGDAPFEPLPREQAPALFEWGLNWAIAASCHQWFSMHAASLERNGNAVILPAPPGTGKSTLCAALALRGWRLLSDELTLLDPLTLEAHALARPINLKNASIQIIKEFEADTRWGPVIYDTTKGRVTHLSPPDDSVRRMRETARPRWIVFPRYVPDAEPSLIPKPRYETFIRMTENAFNYSVLGETGFEVVGKLVEQSDCYDFSYGRLEDALEVFEWLASEQDEGHGGEQVPI